jgi:hypothetical protein
LAYRTGARRASSSPPCGVERSGFLRDSHLPYSAECVEGEFCEHDLLTCGEIMQWLTGPALSLAVPVLPRYRRQQGPMLRLYGEIVVEANVSRCSLPSDSCWICKPVQRLATTNRSLVLSRSAVRVRSSDLSFRIGMRNIRLHPPHSGCSFPTECTTDVHVAWADLRCSFRPDLQHSPVMSSS